MDHLTNVFGMLVEDIARGFQANAIDENGDGLVSKLESFNAPKILGLDRLDSELEVFKAYYLSTQPLSTYGWYYVEAIGFTKDHYLPILQIVSDTTENFWKSFKVDIREYGKFRQFETAVRAALFNEFEVHFWCITGFLDQTYISSGFDFNGFGFQLQDGDSGVATDNLRLTCFQTLAYVDKA